jgi:hypothetical protein
MGIESLFVVAHATGRTLVLPPYDNIYLLDKKHKDPEDKKEHNQMGVRDFYDMKLLKSQKGFHVTSMKKFLQKEAMSGNLKGKYPSRNDTSLWGGNLWRYLQDVADVRPQWFDMVVAFPDKNGDFKLATYNDSGRLQQFLLQYDHNMVRKVAYYDESLQKAHHIHFPGGDSHRILQHHYGK